LLLSLVFAYIYISQGSVESHLLLGGIILSLTVLQNLVVSGNTTAMQSLLKLHQRVVSISNQFTLVTKHCQCLILETVGQPRQHIVIC